MYNGEVIGILLQERGKTKKELGEYLGSTASNAYTQVAKGNPTVSRLEKVADFFGVSMDVFFVRSEDKYKPDRNKDKEIEDLKEMVSVYAQLATEKDQRIKLLEEKIAYLSRPNIQGKV